MPISYKLDRARRSILTTATGAITSEDIRSHFQAVRQEQAASYAELIDAQTATGQDLSSTDISNAAGLIEASSCQERFGPRAVVVGSAVAFGMTRMLAILLSDHLAMEIFYDRDEAERWLALSGPPEGG